MAQGEPGIGIFQTQPWPRKACSQLLFRGTFWENVTSEAEMGVSGSKSRSVLEPDGP